MPAYFDTGFSVREPMWHGEGLVLDDYPTDWEDAREKAGLLWEPAIKPVYHLDDRVLVCMACGAALNTHHWTDCTRESVDALVTPADIDGELLAKGIVEDADHRLVVRDDTQAVLGTVSDQFALIEHSVMGQILEAMLGLPNVKFETAGSCKGGAMVWALAYLDEPYTVAGDNTETYPFVALLNSHDGSGACKVTRTQIRVVCWNTYQAASMQGDRSGLQFVFRHVGDVAGRIEDAKEALAGARSEAKEWDELAKELYEVPVSDKQFQRFLVDFIPEPPAEVVSTRVRNNIDRARKTFKYLYLDSLTTEAHRGTALGLLDASVEYLDHVRGSRNRDTLMGRTLLRPEPLKARALGLIREAVKA